MQILTALLIAALCPTQAQQAALDYQSKLLQDCWKDKTILLERSGETPGDIATAAISQCAVYIVKSAEASDHCAGRPLQIRPMLEKRIREAVIAEVVTIRSSR